VGARRHPVLGHVDGEEGSVDPEHGLRLRPGEQTAGDLSEPARQVEQGLRWMADQVHQRERDESRGCPKRKLK
jgi:hypothetical protein